MIIDTNALRNILPAVDELGLGLGVTVADLRLIDEQPEVGYVEDVVVVDGVVEIVFNANEYNESTEGVQDMNDSELDDDVAFKEGVFIGE